VYPAAAFDGPTQSKGGTKSAPASGSAAKPAAEGAAKAKPITLPPGEKPGCMKQCLPMFGGEGPQWGDAVAEESDSEVAGVLFVEHEDLRVRGPADWPGSRYSCFLFFGRACGAGCPIRLSKRRRIASAGPERAVIFLYQ
ncbi:hypothetical protein LCGC14_2990810, partial [marine sediment metagenome]